MENKQLQGQLIFRQGLKKHGAFTADESPCEVEIISDTEAVFRGNEWENQAMFDHHGHALNSITAFGK